MGIAASSRVALATVLAATVLLLGPGPGARAAGPPVVESSWVTGVTATSATLHASINPNGLNSTYRFEYLTQAAWEANGFTGAAITPPSGAGSLGAGADPVGVSRQITSLLPTTTYRYRVRASNGTVVFGTERTLTTEVPSNVFKLADGRAWELVSPVDKEGGAVAAPESLFGGGVFQAAANGGSIAYGSASSFAGGAGALGASQYVATRLPGAWSTQNVTTPMVSGSYGDQPDGTPYRIFSQDLSLALLSDGVRCRSVAGLCPVANPPLPGSGAPAGYRNYYLRDGGGFTALLDGTDLAGLGLGADEFEIAFVGATPDLLYLVLSSCAKLAPAATEVPAAGGCDEGKQNLYEWSGGALVPLNLLPGESTTSPGAVLAAPAGALSSDGARVYFKLLEGGRIYLREAGGPTKLLPDSEGGVFQAASADGSLAFFTEGGTLYRYDAGTEASEAIAAGVKGVLGASSDGAYVYYQDAAGLQRWHAGSSLQIAAGADAALASDYPPATGTSRVSADGTRLAFLSAAELTSYDNTDVNTGTPDTELYLYRESAGSGTEALICVSCNPTGERPEGSAGIPGAYANGTLNLYKPRVLTASGNRLFFDSQDRLAVTDTNGRADVYEWEAVGTGDCGRAPGCVGLLSEGRTQGSAFVDASSSGDDAFFLTGESLVGTDPGSIDLYDAKAGGGLAEPVKPFVCLGDACQALPSPPDDPTPGTLVPNSGNPPPQVVKHRHKRKRKHHRGALR